MPTTWGKDLFLHVYQNNRDEKEHIAIVFGDQWRSRSLSSHREGETDIDRILKGAYLGKLVPGMTTSLVAEMTEQYLKEKPEVDGPPLVRIHSECCTGDTFWSTRCDCGEQLNEAARLMVSSISGGIIVYLRQEGRDIGIVAKLKTCNLQDLGFDTLDSNLLVGKPVDGRSYGVATSILLDLGCGGGRNIRLLTNNMDKVKAVERPEQDIKVVERIPMPPISWRTGGEAGRSSKELQQYLYAKVVRMGHDMGHEGIPEMNVGDNKGGETYGLAREILKLHMDKFCPIVLSDPQ